jgi:hypothetical protein
MLAVLAAAVSTAAVAGELKQGKTTAPAATATQMTDSEMDRVTAGALPVTPQLGIGTAQSAGADVSLPTPPDAAVVVRPGSGVDTFQGKL